MRRGFRGIHRQCVEPFDLLRMALRDDDDGIFSLAASALAAVATTDSTIDVEDAPATEATEPAEETGTEDAPVEGTVAAADEATS